MVAALVGEDLMIWVTVESVCFILETKSVYQLYFNFLKSEALWRQVVV